MRTLSVLSMLLGLALVGGSVYMYFNHHFGANTTFAIAAVGLFQFVFALVVTLRLSNPVDASKNSFSPTSSYSPPANY